MKRHASITCLALIFGTACADEVEPGWELDSTPAAVDQQVLNTLAESGQARAIVEFEAGVAPRVRDNVLTHSYRRLPLAAVTVRSLDDVDTLARTPGVLRVHAETIFKATRLSDGLEMVHQPLAAAKGLTGQGTAVAVLDTGVDFTDAAFGSCTRAGAAGCRVVASKDFAPEDGTADGPSHHGTNVAAIAAAIAPNTDIVALDVFDGARASSLDIVAAIDWAIENKDRYGIATLNLSLGTDQLFGSACDNVPFATAIEAALREGIVTVTSSGNSGASDAVSAPGCVSAAVTVGAIHATDVVASYAVCTDDAVAGAVACFSNSSRGVDLLAPGSRVDAGGVAMTGTSQAAPHVAGAIAAVVSGSHYSPAEAADLLINVGVPVLDGRNSLTFPRLDLEGVVAQLVAPPTPSEPVPPVTPQEPVTPEEPVTPPQEPAAPEEPLPAPSDSDMFVVINGGASATTSRDVTLTIWAPQAAVACVSNATTCTEFAEIRETVEWTLGEPDDDGFLTVYVWVPAPEEGIFRNILLTDRIAYRP